MQWWPTTSNEDSPFEDSTEDDSTISMSDIVAGVAGAAVGDQVAFSPDGHMELSEDINDVGHDIKDEYGWNFRAGWGWWYRETLPLQV